jgi:hypothetical protein
MRTATIQAQGHNGKVTLLHSFVDDFAKAQAFIKSLHGRRSHEAYKTVVYQENDGDEVRFNFLTPEAEAELNARRQKENELQKAFLEKVSQPKPAAQQPAKKLPSMKKTIVSLILAIFTLSAIAAVEIPTTFSVSGTISPWAKTNYAVIPAGDGIPRVQYVKVTSDNATNCISFWSPATTNWVLTFAAAISQPTVTVKAVGTAFTADDMYIIRHAASGLCEMKQVLSTNGNTTNVTFTANLEEAVVAGDVMWKVSKDVNIVTGNAAVEINCGAGAVYNGKRNKPVLVQQTAATNCTIWAISGIYQK